MLINGSRLTGYPVLSLHVGGRIATIATPIIDPENLKIIAYEVEGPLVGREVGEILPTDSIREFSRLGMIVDSADEFVGPDEIIRVKDVLASDFKLIGIKVETKRGTKLGKVVDYTLTPDTWEIQQLIVQRPFLKAIIDPELTISRHKIVEISNSKVIIKDETEKSLKQAPAKADFVPNFVNPFREPDFATETQAHKDN